jgi:hypothetical protein
MRVKVFVYNLIFFVLILSIGLIFPLNKDIGGGSGKKITPYVPDKEIKLEEVSLIKSICTRSRNIEHLKLKGTNVTKYGNGVGLMYVKGADVNGDPFFILEGKKETDGSIIKIDFSEIKSFSLLRVKKRLFSKVRALLEVTIFPTISAEELLALKPSYSELAENYTKKVRLWIPLEKKGELCLIGKKFSFDTGDEEYKILAKMLDVQLDSEVILGYAPFKMESIGALIFPIWWAIHSVIKDDLYPYKLAFKKRADI